METYTKIVRQDVDGKDEEFIKVSETRVVTRTISVEELQAQKARIEEMLATEVK